jgi:small-conductance mechanosensitive channel
MFGLEDHLFGNTVLDWIVALSIVAGVTVLARIAQRWLGRRLLARAVHSGAALGDILANLVIRTRSLFLLAFSITLAAQFLTLRPRQEHYLDLVFPVALILQLAAWGNWGVDLWIERRFQGEADGDGTSASRAAVLGFIVRLGLWSLVLLSVLDVMGFNITTLLASLGIGGIAVALALQNVLGDLFASLAITLDKPFLVGDYISVDQCEGTVQFIGLKTTRIRSLSGEQIIISNGDLLKSRIRNFRDMAERRVVFKLSLSYLTPADLVAQVPAQLERIVAAQPRTRFERAHLKEFTSTGLSLEVVYHLLDPDYLLYMDTQQAINLEILRACHAQGIAFSLPALPGELVPGPRTEGSPEIH